MTPEFEKQIAHVCAKVHDLLGDPIDQLTGDIETEKITLTIPKAYSYLAMYIAMLIDDPGAPVSALGHHEEAFKRKYKGQRGAMRELLEHIVISEMSQHHHELCTRTHPLLEVPEMIAEE